MNELPKTIKPGEELEVQIAPYGDYPCRDGDPGHDGFVQRVTPGAVRRIVENFKPEILVDMDHASETGGGTAAAAWITALRADPERGLVGTFKFTDTGAAAVAARRRHYIFQYTFSGEGVFMNSQGTHVCGSCTAFLAASHDPNIAYGYPADKTEPWKFVFLDFGGQAGCAMAQYLIRRYGAIYELPPKHPVIERLLSFHVYDQIGCSISSLEGSKLVVDLLNALLVSKEEEPDLKTGNQLVRRVHEYVQTHIGEPISVVDIASRFGVSREHLTRVFAEHGATTPYQYILSSKISAACRLLHEGDLSVKEVSNKLGFANTAHFARAFKRIMRCTPNEYRNIGVLPANTRLKIF